MVAKPVEECELEPQKVIFLFIPSFFFLSPGVRTRDQACAAPGGSPPVCGCATGGVRCVKNTSKEEEEAFHHDLVL